MVIQELNPEFSQATRSQLIQNLIDNICLYTTSHPEWIQRKQIQLSTPQSRLGKKKQKLYEQQQRHNTLHLVDIPQTTKTVNSVRTSDFTEEEQTRTLTKRFLVRGHWRQQAYGEGFQKHKLIFIAPFWKGPEDGELIEKVYTVGVKKEDHE